MSGQLSENEPEANETIVGTANTDGFWTDSDNFTAMDGLKGYYSHCKLQSFVRNLPRNILEDDEIDEHMKRCQIDQSGIKEKIPGEELRTISKDLLWSLQAKKYALTETLLTIQLAIQNLVSIHRKETMKSTVTKTETTNQIPEDRPGDKTESNPTNQLKSSEESPPIIRVSDVVNQKDEKDNIKVDSSVNNSDENIIPPVMTASSIAQTKIYKQAHDIFSDTNVGNKELHCEDANTLNKDYDVVGLRTETDTSQVCEQSKHANDSNGSQGQQSEKTGSAEWMKLPLDTRYQGDHVTLPVLTAESERVKTELDGLPELVKVHD